MDLAYPENVLDIKSEFDNEVTNFVKANAGMGFIWGSYGVIWGSYGGHMGSVAVIWGDVG